jgi:hypothetical protein
LPSTSASGRPGSGRNCGSSLVAGRFERGHGRHGFGGVFPGHRFLAAQRRLGDFAVRRARRVAAEVDFFERKRVSRPEDGAHVVHAAHVVEHQNHGAFGRTFEVIDRGSVQLGHCEFSHRNSANFAVRFVGLK